MGSFSPFPLREGGRGVRFFSANATGRLRGFLATGPWLFRVAAQAFGPAILSRWMSDLPGVGVVAISLGIVIAAFVMSMFFVPALTALLGHSAWWPGHGDEKRPEKISAV